MFISDSFDVAAQRAADFFFISGNHRRKMPGSLFFFSFAVFLLCRPSFSFASRRRQRINKLHCFFLNFQYDGRLFMFDMMKGGPFIARYRFRCKSKCRETKLLEGKQFSFSIETKGNKFQLSILFLSH